MVKIGFDFGVTALEGLAFEDFAFLVGLELFYDRDILAVFDHAVLKNRDYFHGPHDLTPHNLFGGNP